ncbi:MAG: DUF2007 domain-containing protein [Maribacter sp.]|uniref:putative signal transducing protein n=1 Tax=Maribacter sp. 2307UL18-2 TaxID=3386274 RepID=UPI0039BD775A
MDSNYTRIFIGSQVQAQSLVGRLTAVGINPVVKDEAESARLAGFGSSTTSSSEIYVHKDELKKAESVLDQATDTP